MNKNYQKQLDLILEQIERDCVTPSLFLHACCAPCSSYCLEYLSSFFSITVYFYNPNISSDEEYLKRKNELIRFINELSSNSNIDSKISFKNEVKFIDGDYNPKEFYDIAKGLEKCPERGERCYKCYELRLEKTAVLASSMNYDYFTTTLSISPHKNAEWINEIGDRLGELYGIKHLPSDFKKKNGYKRSIELSEEYNLYRQNFCGCIFSKNNC